nr:alpha/beta-Hydrolases superfamily protein [Ipomoea batatas]
MRPGVSDLSTFVAITGQITGLCCDLSAFQICRPFQISSCDQASLSSCDRDEDHPIHFVGHSAGAQVVRVLQQMLADKVWFVILIINSRKSGLAYAFYNKQKYKTKT